METWRRASRDASDRGLSLLESHGHRLSDDIPRTRRPTIVVFVSAVNQPRCADVVRSQRARHIEPCMPSPTRDPTRLCLAVGDFLDPSGVTIWAVAGGGWQRGMRC